MNKIGKIFALSLTACVLGSCAPKNVTPTYMVVWKNWNGAILEIDEHVKRGSFPEYNGETPTRPDEYGRSYSFSGWTPDLAKVTENIAYTAKFTVDRYMVDFDLDGGTSYSYNGPQTVYSFSTSYFFFDVVKEGHTFRGWSFNGTKIIDEKGNLLEEPVMQKEMTFKAVYSQTSFVTITSNYPEAATITGEGEYPYNSFVNLNALVNDGYEFLGWYQDNSQVSALANYQFILRNKDVSFEARFRLRTYNLLIQSGNYGKVLLDSDNVQEARTNYDVDKQYKTTMSLAAIGTSSENIPFFGWLGIEQQPATYTYELISSSPIIDFTMPSTNYELTAVWDRFDVHYVLDGGTNNPNNPTIFSSNSGNIQLYNPTRPGYEFLRWDLTTYLRDGNMFEYHELIENVTEIDCSQYYLVAQLTAVWEASTYSITYELNDGINSPNNPSTYTPDDNTITLSSPTKHGYNFIGWYTSETSLNPEYKVEKIQKGSYGNLTLYARWAPISYEITYNLDGGINNPDNRDFYNIESSFTFLSPTRTGYTFLGWFDENNNQVTSIEVGTTGNLTLTARWNEGNAYVVTLDPDGGIVIESTINVQYDHAYFLPTPTRVGYAFLGWYDNQTKINESGTWKDTTNKTFTAHWSIINYQITYKLNGGVNDPSNPTTYNVESSTITLMNPTKNRNTFAGWSCDGQTITSIQTGSTGNMVLTANWIENSYPVSVVINNELLGSVSGAGSYIFNESVTLTAIPTDDSLFVGWYSDSNFTNLISSSNPYSFNLENENLIIYAKFITKAEDYALRYATIPVLSDNGKTVTYGLYPQTNVNDPALISELDTLTAPESNGWYLYNNEYYAKVDANQYYTSSYRFDNGTKIVNGTIYWFKCEPIVWNVLSNNDGVYYLLSSVLLDAQKYNLTFTEGINACNYEYSSIRAWLNNDFYNSAFALGSNHIQTTLVDNSTSTTGSSNNAYICNDTQDKVFLPSYRNYTNLSYGFATTKNSSNTRYCKTTDWARAKGAQCTSDSPNYYYNGDYWTRSPSGYNSSYVYVITDSGVIAHTEVYNSGMSVRPAITIRID